MVSSSKTRYRIHAINTLQQRASQSKLWGWGVFILMSISFGISSILIINIIKFSKENIILTSKQPLLLPLLINSLLVSLYLALLASTSISKEYKNGTLEILMVAPVDEFSFIVGNYLAHIKVFAFTLLAALVWAYLNIWYLNFSPRLDILTLLFSTLFMASELIAFGILTAVWGGKTKNALIYFILIVLLFGGIQLANFIVSGIVQMGNAPVSHSLILVRNALSTINRLINWISPYAQLRYAMEAILEHRVITFLLSSAGMLLETAIMLFGSLWLLKKKGVRGA